MFSWVSRFSPIAVLSLAVACDPSTSPENAGPLVDVTLTMDGRHQCADAEPRERLGAFERRTRAVPAPTDPWTWGGGITVGDLNNDGWLDTLVVVEPGLDLYPGGADQSFESVGQDVFGAFDLSFASGTSLADFDGDGDLDIYVTRVRGAPIPESFEKPDQGRNVLLRNEGDGRTFVDVTDEAGVDACGQDQRTKEPEVSCFRSMSSSWADFDGDGDLDLFVGNYGFVDESDGTTQERMAPAERSFLYANNGDGSFADVSDMLPRELNDGYTYAGGFLDLDGDRDPDLYTVNDFGIVAPNRVLWNENGTLVFDPDEPSGLVQAMTGMGLGVGDLNGDGWPDLAIPQWGRNALLLSNAELGQWFDAAQATGFLAVRDRDQVVGWGTELGDLDNDGDLDIISQYGFLPNDNQQVWSNPIRQPDGLYLNESVLGENGDIEVLFRDVAQSWEVADTGLMRGAVLADLNRDGWLDIGKRNLGGDSVVYLSRCGNARALTLRLRQPGMNRYAVGASVMVDVRGREIRRELVAGGTGYASSGPPELHFGIGLDSVVSRIEVTWPDGARSVVRHVPAMQEITLTRTDGPSTR